MEGAMKFAAWLPPFLLAVLLAPMIGRAAPVASPHAATELVARSAATPGATVWVAVVQTLDTGWHSYWRNPGDAGEATAVRWTLPPGWRAGDIVWPTPTRLPVGPIMNYGYAGRVVLPVPIRVPADARIGDRAKVSATVDYLVCAEVCVPGSVAVDLTLPVTAAPPPKDPAGAAVIEGALARAPAAGGLAATFQASAGRLTLAVAGEALRGGAARDAYFYPYAGDLIDHAKPQTLDRGPRGLTLTLAPGSAFATGGGPETAAGVLTVGGRAFEVTAPRGPPPAGAGGLGPPAPRAPFAPSFLLAVGGAFLGGIILNLMPCVFPILSMKATALAGHAGDVRRARVQALAFLAGVLAGFLGLAGLLIAARGGGAAVGWGFQLQSPMAVSLLGLVMLAAGLNLSGLFEIGVSAQGLGSRLAARGGLAGAGATGLLAVVVAAPCTAPFMGPALGFALTQPAPVALAVFAALGLGFAAPLCLLSSIPALIRRLPRPGPWMEILRKALAFPMYASAAWLAWVVARQAGADGLARMLAAAVAVALAAWVFGLAQRSGRRALSAAAAASLAVALGLVVAGANAGPAAAEAWSPQRVQALRAEHRPVLVNFTAAWCVTCQVNERLALSDAAVARALRRTGAAYLVADWTNRDPEIAQALGERGRIGVPLYLVYGADGGPPRVLPQLLTPALVSGALDRAATPPP
jgi:thiol:disulfide interchange protein DsbD